jgi:hypothetical protein
MAMTGLCGNDGFVFAAEPTQMAAAMPGNPVMLASH